MLSAQDPRPANSHPPRSASMSDSSDDGDEMCDNYRIDMTHATFGTCNCGKPKSVHPVTTKAGAKKIHSSLEGKPPAGGGVTSKWQPQFQFSLLQKKAAAEESKVRAIRTLQRDSHSHANASLASFGSSRRRLTRRPRPPSPPRPFSPIGGLQSSTRGRSAKPRWRWWSSSEGSGAPQWRRWRTR